MLNVIDCQGTRGENIHRLLYQGKQPQPVFSLPWKCDACEGGIPIEVGTVPTQAKSISGIAQCRTKDPILKKV